MAALKRFMKTALNPLLSVLLSDMSRPAAAAAGAAKVVADVISVPGVGLAASVLKEVVGQCEQVELQHEECRLLRQECRSLITSLERHDLRSPGFEELQSDIDELCEIDMSRISKWNDRNFLYRWYKRDDIKNDIRSCHSRVQTANQAFNNDGTIRIRQALPMLENKLSKIENTLNQIHHNEGLPHSVQDMFVPQILVATKASGPATHVPPTVPAEEITSLGDLLGEVLNMGGEIKLDHNNTPQSAGIFTEVWKGRWMRNGQEVAIKTIREVTPDQKAFDKFRQQLQVWKEVPNHPNIAQFLGICIADTRGRHIGLVSSWQSHGNVTEYLQKYPNGDRLSLMRGAAEGLSHLHEHNIVHGHVRCANILVSHELTAQICDFGLSKVVEKVTGKNLVASLSGSQDSRLRWMPPELTYIEPGTETSSSFVTDVYSFGMTILECITGQHPYANLKREANVVYAISHGTHPERPTGPAVERWLSDSLWALLKECWSSSPSSRPTMAAVVQRLTELQKTGHVA